MLWKKLENEKKHNQVWKETTVVGVSIAYFESRMQDQQDDARGGATVQRVYVPICDLQCNELLKAHTGVTIMDA